MAPPDLPSCWANISPNYAGSFRANYQLTVAACVVPGVLGSDTHLDTPHDHAPVSSEFCKHFVPFLSNSFSHKQSLSS